MKRESIYAGIPEVIAEEKFDDIVRTNAVRIERIVSRGHASPEDFWYDQDWNEWVILLKGSACLLFQENGEQVTLKPGDWVDIPAQCKHRVEWTDPEEDTVWLAVHYKGA